MYIHTVVRGFPRFPAILSVVSEKPVKRFGLISPYYLLEGSYRLPDPDRYLLVCLMLCWSALGYMYS